MPNEKVNEPNPPGAQRWREAWRALGVQPPPAEVFRALVAGYNEPSRAYHTLQHLAASLQELDAVRNLCERPEEVEIALWFHDAIYDTHRSDNEERCARWAEEVLLACGVSALCAGSVRDLILATRHNAPSQIHDAALLVDIDLAILGAEPERFDEYEQAVREEYAWVPEEEFRVGRAAVLRDFLSRSAIYSTPLFRERLEAVARHNIERSLAALEGRTPFQAKR